MLVSCCGLLVYRRCIRAYIKRVFWYFAANGAKTGVDRLKAAFLQNRINTIIENNDF